MIRKRIEIEIREGVRVALLLTPALYGVASRRGVDIVAELKGEHNDSSDIVRVYTKMLYFAALNEWEVAAVDNPKAEPFAYTFADFDAWAWEHPEALKDAVNALLEAFTGKPLSDYEGVKKKSKSRK